MTSFDPEQFTLLYHPGIPGRAEFVRVYLEATATAYDEPVLKGGYDLMTPFISSSEAKSGSPEVTAFAPPILLHRGNSIAQTAAIVGYLDAVLPPIDLEVEGGKETKLAESAGFVWEKNALMATICDAVNEIHNTHHPIDPMGYYEDQADAAQVFTKAFRTARLPKFLQHFERSIGQNGWFYSCGPTYVDVAMWELVDGLRYAFPNLMKRLEGDYPNIVKLAGVVASSPRIKKYLASERRQKYSNGIFRNYEELDPVDE